MKQKRNRTINIQYILRKIFELMRIKYEHIEISE